MKKDITFCTHTSSRSFEHPVQHYPLSTAARSGERFVITGVRYDTATWNELSVNDP